MHENLHDLYSEIRTEILDDLKDMLNGLEDTARGVIKQCINDLAFYSSRLLIERVPDERARIENIIGHIQGIMESEAAAASIQAYARARKIAARVLRGAVKVAVGFLESV